MKLYFPPTYGGVWSASRIVEGRWLALFERDSLYEPQDAAVILGALGIAITDSHLDRYFPVLGSKGRCPTRELMELFSYLPPGHGAEVGV